MRRDWLAARGRVHKLTLFTHNFMDACALDSERIEACVFMAMTQDGPLSMCAYNAQRDAYLLKPLQTSHGVWQPLRQGPAGAAVGLAQPTVKASLAADSSIIASFPVKWLKGRSRAHAMQARSQRADPANHLTSP